MTHQHHHKPSIRRRIKGFMLRYMHGMITCQQLEGFILEYLDGGLTPKQRRVFERHLRICRECREYLAAYRRTMELNRATLLSQQQTLHDDVPEDLITAVMDAYHKK